VILTDGEVFRLEPGTLQATPETVPSRSLEASLPRDQQKAQIEAVLRETRGRISGPDGAAARLGIPASTLESRIRVLKINKHLYRSNV
jgi:formate hydrogenlyase transcriptional activator